MTSFPAPAPVSAQNSPYAVEVEVEAGKTYFWCACGLSKKQPFCDGAHKGTGLKSQVFTAESTGTVYLCGCKATATGPFCDGSHQDGSHQDGSRQKEAES